MMSFFFFFFFMDLVCILAGWGGVFALHRQGRITPQPACPSAPVFGNGPAEYTSIYLLQFEILHTYSGITAPKGRL